MQRFFYLYTAYLLTISIFFGRKGNCIMFAIIETGGKQHMVKEGELVRVSKLPEQEGQEVVFASVVLYSEGKSMKVGTPHIEDLEVRGKVIEEGKGEKLIVYKYKRRKRSAVKKGHRQQYTEVKITSIGPKAETEDKPKAQTVTPRKTPTTWKKAEPAKVAK